MTNSRPKLDSARIYTQSQNLTLPKKQRGAVLIISLVLLLIMTFIGIASMNTSLMQEKMAANAQNTNLTFQAAESAIGAVIATVLGGNQDPLSDAMEALNQQGDEVVFSVSDPNVDANYRVTYQGVVTLTSGGSLDADESATTLQAHRFDLAGTGLIPETNAQTVIRQGIEYR